VLSAYLEVWLALWQCQIAVIQALLPKAAPPPPSNVLQFRAPRSRTG
jgi:hypothetical protein